MNDDQKRDILRTQVKIKPFNPNLLEELCAAAQADNGHGVIAPSQVIEKNGEIAGFLSIGNVPTMLMWLDSKKINVRDSINVMQFAENWVHAGGGRSILIPCMDNSPLRPYIESAGYSKVCSATLFIKPLC